MKLRILLALALVAACHPTPPPSDATAVSDAGAAAPTLDASPASCAQWCEHAAELKCPSAKPTPLGASCTEVCTNANDGPIHWNLKCRIAAKSCAAADACQ